MNKQALFHQSDSRYCYSLGGSKAHLVLRTAKNDDLAQVEVLYSSFGELYHDVSSAAMKKTHTDELFDYYELDLDNGHPGYCYVFRLTETDRTVTYYSESGLTSSYNFQEAFLDEFMFAFPNESDLVRENPSFSGRLFYQIFPERFACSDFSKPGITQKWDQTKPDNLKYCGGDFKGLTAKLDYLAALGVGALYLNPIHPAASAHMYDVEDYLKVNPRLGTEEDFRRLIKEAHKRDIKIVMDLVFNHSSNKNWLFQDVIERGKESPYWSWYFINGDKPTTKKPLNYLSFAGVLTMPKLNSNNPAVRNYLCHVGEYWLSEFGVDGYRLDVSFDVAHLFWREFRTRCLKVNPTCLLIGEDWLNSESYLGGDEWDSVMNYPVRTALMRYKEEGFSVTRLAERLDGLLMRYREPTNRNLMNLLSSHDVARWLTELHGDRDYYLQSYAFLMFYPGLPCVYYGDEIFMEGGNDPDCRRGMRWDSPEFQGNDYQAFRALCLLRKKAILAKGATRIYAQDETLVIERYTEGESLLLALNLGKKEAVSPKGKTLLSRKATATTLEPGGYVVVERNL